MHVFSSVELFACKLLVNFILHLLINSLKYFACLFIIFFIGIFQLSF
jgi:hypothetical protein